MNRAINNKKTDIICLWIYTIEHPLSQGSNYLYYIKIYSVMKNCITGTFLFFLSLLLIYEGGWPHRVEKMGLFFA